MRQDKYDYNEAARRYAEKLDRIDRAIEDKSRQDIVDCIDYSVYATADFDKGISHGGITLSAGQLFRNDCGNCHD